MSITTSTGFRLVVYQKKQPQTQLTDDGGVLELSDSHPDLMRIQQGMSNSQLRIACTTREILEVPT